MSKVSIPKYSLSEELINAISHGLGVGLGIVVLVLTICFSAAHHNVVGVVSSCIYGSTMIIMYLISCLYHALSPKLKAKKVFRVLDHCDIYAFIAGCYTPYSLCLIGGVKGWVIFGIIWACAIIGILLNAINLEKYQVISNIMYLGMGWMIIISFNSIRKEILLPGLILLVLGGIVYTIGAVLYGLGAKKKYLHSIFHFFVLGGSILHFLSILLYVL